MQSNQTLKNLQNAINNGERIDNDELMKILVNVGYGFLYFINRNQDQGYMLKIANVEIEKDNISLEFKEEVPKAPWTKEPTEPPINNFEIITVPKKELENIKNIIATSLKQQGIEFYDDYFLDLSTDCLPQSLNPVNTRYNDEKDKNRQLRTETWMDVKDHPDRYARLLMENYIEIYNLINNEPFDDKQKQTVLTKLDLMEHKFKGYIKEVLDEMYPDKNVVQKDASIEK